MDKAWLGVDAGKEFHWAHLLDALGAQLFSRRVENDEADLLALIDETLSFAEEIVWAIDQPGDSAALLLALLWERDFSSAKNVCRAEGTVLENPPSETREYNVSLTLERA